jgi:predicted Fe-Mo cluster-binding NifX family protein
MWAKNDQSLKFMIDKKQKIGISAVASDFNSLVDSRFGRCSYFLVFDNEGKLIDSISNEGQQARRGAGVAAAQGLIDYGVDVVISGRIGPNAYPVLSSAGIKVFIIDYDITADRALEEYKRGKLKEVKSSARENGLFMSSGRGIGRKFRKK